MVGRWHISEQEVYSQDLDATQSAQAVPYGTIVRGTYTGFASGSANYGAGEFIYLKGVASTVVGSLVVYDPLNGSTTLAPDTAKQGEPVAVAMSANVANQNGWYQIAGPAVIKKTAVAVNPGVAVYLSGTAGRVMPTLASGKQLLGARSVNASTVTSTTSTITVVLNRPHLQGEAGAA